MSTLSIDSESLPLFHSHNIGHKGVGPVLRVPFGKLAFITVSLPLFSFIFCVVWSLLFNFESSTATHCEVRNFLPSISEAVGSYTPQQQIWQAAIALHALPRIFVAGMYYSYYQEVLYRWVHFMGGFACFLNIVENFSLIGLTFISSRDNYSAHKMCFVTFMVTSEFYMALTCYLLKTMRRTPPSNVEARSFRMKCKLLLTNVSSFSLAGYFFIRHNSYCEPGVYSLFALCEYVVVLTNMGFHMTAYWDFHGRDLLLSPGQLRVR